MIPVDILNLEMIVKIVKILFALVTFVYSLLILRNLVDLQDNYNSIVYGLFLLFSGFFILLSGVSLAGLLFY